MTNNKMIFEISTIDHMYPDGVGYKFTLEYNDEDESFNSSSIVSLSMIEDTSILPSAFRSAYMSLFTDVSEKYVDLKFGNMATTYWTSSNFIITQLDSLAYSIITMMVDGDNFTYTCNLTMNEDMITDVITHLVSNVGQH